MTTRRPTPAGSSDPIPALDEVRDGPPPEVVLTQPPSHAGALALATVSVAAASASVLLAEAPTCGASRAEEVIAHADTASSALRRAQVVTALQEVAVAMGWRRHSTTRGIDNGMHTAGVAMPVETTPTEVQPLPLPPQTRPEDLTADGQMPAVRPRPLPQVRTQPREVPRPGRRAAVHPERDPFKP